MSKRLVSDLKRWHERYSEFWSDWKKQKGNGLTLQDVAIIEFFISNNFVISETPIGFGEATYIRQTIIKLKKYYPQYKSFVIKEFLYFIIKNAIINGWNKFLSSPIDKLPLPIEIRRKFKAFGFPTLKKFISVYTNDGFNKDYVFVHILKFKDEIRGDIVIYRNLKAKASTQVYAKAS